MTRLKRVETGLRRMRLTTFKHIMKLETTRHMGTAKLCHFYIRQILNITFKSS
jgi:hypothetical protein